MALWVGGARNLVFRGYPNWGDCALRVALGLSGYGREQWAGPGREKWRMLL